MNVADFNKMELSVFPNPAKDFFAVQIPMATSDYKVELIDELGKLIQTQTVWLYTMKAVTGKN